MTNRFNTRARLMSGGAIGAAMLLAFAGAAHAQTATQSAPAPDGDVAQVDEIIVTGIRASLASSVGTKRRESSIVEVVTAEDIGKLPDQSIAEAIARLPGLTAQRLDGRAQSISVRGLGPDFTTALLNGREQVTTGDNRGVEFDQYPSELLSSVVVYKTPDARLVGQGLAGTVDLRTVRPLEYGRRALAMNYRYEWNDLESLNAGAEDTGQRYSLSYIDQFADGTVGVALGYAHIESPYQNERYNAWGYATVDCGPAYICTDPDGAGPLSPVANPGYASAIGTPVLGGAKPYAQSSLLERDGYMGVLQWTPNDRFSSTFDAFYSEFSNRQIQRGIEIPLWWGGQGEVLQPGYTIEDGIITDATFTNVKGVVRNDLNTRDASTLALGWNTRFQVNDIWSVTADLSHSKVERTDQIIESYAGTGYNAAGARDTISYSIDDNGVASFDVGLDYTNPNLFFLTDPRGWGGSRIQAGYIGSPTVEDELNAIRLSTKGEIDQGFIKSVELGVNVSTRDKSFVADEFFLVPANGQSQQPIPTACLLEPTTIGYLGFSMISYDPECVIASGAYARERNLAFDQLSKNWEVNEDINILFFQTNIGADFGSVRMTGNIGFQIQDVKQTGSGFAAGAPPVAGDPALLTPISETANYTDFLPSMNLTFQLTDSDVLRFAAAKVVARPRLDQLRGSQTVTFNPSNLTSTDIDQAYFGGSGGNPNLRPWEANVFDISYEHYFGPGAYVSLAGFYKDLNTYIFNQNVVRDFSGFTYPGAAPTSFLGLYNSPQNGEGGSIQGYEVAVSLPLGDFWSPLEGFGIVASYSDTSSDIQPEPGNPSRPIEGLSEQVANVTAYYERNGFQARVSNRFRSEFLGEVAGFANNRTFRTVGDETIIDAQIGYEFQSGPLEGLSVLLQGNNLTNEEFKTIDGGNDRRAIDYQVYGSTYMFGVNYRF